MEEINGKRFQLRFFSSIFLFIPLFLLFSKNNFIFLLVILLLLSLSLWEFCRLKSFKDYLKKKNINIILSRHKISGLDFVIIFKVNFLLLLTFYYSNYILLFVILIFFFLYSYLILKFDFEKLFRSSLLFNPFLYWLISDMIIIMNNFYFLFSFLRF